MGHTQRSSEHTPYSTQGSLLMCEVSHMMYCVLNQESISCKLSDLSTLISLGETSKSKVIPALIYPYFVSRLISQYRRVNLFRNKILVVFFLALKLGSSSKSQFASHLSTYPCLDRRFSQIKQVMCMKHLDLCWDHTSTVMPL